MNEILTFLGLPLDTAPAEVLAHLTGLKQTLATQACALAQRENPVEIPLPAELRGQIEETLAWLQGLTGEVTAQREALAGEITRLETTARELATEAMRLDAESLRDTQAAGQAQAVQTRAGKVQARLAELREELARVSPPSVYSLARVLDAIIAHWSAELPAIVQRQLGHFDPDPHRIAQVSKLFSAWSHLRGLRSLANEPGATLTPHRVQQAQAILFRALRGRPMLLAEVTP